MITAPRAATRIALVVGALALAGIAVLTRMDRTEKLREDRIARNRRAVVSAIQDVAVAYGNHMERSRDQDRSESLRQFLGELPPYVCVDPGSAILHHGYFIRLVRATKDGELFLCAYPAEYNTTGTMTWILLRGDRGSGIWRKDTGGNPVIDISDEELSLRWSREGCG